MSEDGFNIPAEEIVDESEQPREEEEFLFRSTAKDKPNSDFDTPAETVKEDIEQVDKEEEEEINQNVKDLETEAEVPIDLAEEHGTSNSETMSPSSPGFQETEIVSNIIEGEDTQNNTLECGSLEDMVHDNSSPQEILYDSGDENLNSSGFIPINEVLNNENSSLGSGTETHNQEIENPFNMELQIGISPKTSDSYKQDDANYQNSQQEVVDDHFKNDLMSDEGSVSVEGSMFTSSKILPASTDMNGLEDKANIGDDVTDVNIPNKIMHQNLTSTGLTDENDSIFTSETKDQISSPEERSERLNTNNLELPLTVINSENNDIHSPSELESSPNAENVFLASTFDKEITSGEKNDSSDQAFINDITSQSPSSQLETEINKQKLHIHESDIAVNQQQNEMGNEVLQDSKELSVLDEASITQINKNEDVISKDININYGEIDQNQDKLDRSDNPDSYPKQNDNSIVKTDDDENNNDDDENFVENNTDAADIIHSRAINDTRESLDKEAIDVESFKDEVGTHSSEESYQENIDGDGDGNSDGDEKEIDIMDSDEAKVTEDSQLISSPQTCVASNLSYEKSKEERPEKNTLKEDNIENTDDDPTAMTVTVTNPLSSPDFVISEEDRPDAVQRPIMVSSDQVFPNRGEYSPSFGGIPDEDELDSEDEEEKLQESKIDLGNEEPSSPMFDDKNDEEVFVGLTTSLKQPVKQASNSDKTPSKALVKQIEVDSKQNISTYRKKEQQMIEEIKKEKLAASVKKSESKKSDTTNQTIGIASHSIEQPKTESVTDEFVKKSSNIKPNDTKVHESDIYNSDEKGYSPENSILEKKTNSSPKSSEQEGSKKKKKKKKKSPKQLKVTTSLDNFHDELSPTSIYSKPSPSDDNSPVAKVEKVKNKKSKKKQSSLDEGSENFIPVFSPSSASMKSSEMKSPEELILDDFSLEKRSNDEKMSLSFDSPSSMSKKKKKKRGNKKKKGGKSKSPGKSSMSSSDAGSQNPISPWDLPVSNSKGVKVKVIKSKPVNKSHSESVLPSIGSKMNSFKSKSDISTLQILPQIQRVGGIEAYKEKLERKKRYEERQQKHKEQLLEEQIRRQKKFEREERQRMELELQRKSQFTRLKKSLGTLDFKRPAFR